MKESLVLTVIGLDEPGLVEAISDAVLGHGANWEASRMSRLAGRFAGILQVTVQADQADRLVSALRGLQDRGLKVVVEKSADKPRPQTRTLRLDLIGNDRPGITRQIASALAARGVNVDELSTRCEAAPMSGGMLFKLTADLRCPSTLDLAELRTALETIANDLMVDLDLRELD
jgi:glycine cleavage system regulatory protein